MKQIFLGLFLAALCMNADVLKLRNGQRYEGKVTKKGSTYTVVVKDGAMYQFSAGEVKSMNDQEVAQEKNPVVKIATSKGEMLVELFEDETPNTVANFIELAEKGFYRGMAFHRVINGFMAQGGCPYSKRGAMGMPGTGGPGYTFDNETRPNLKHNGRGILSMANAGPDTNGSQFFLCFQPAPWLDGKHTVFGKVIQGIEVLDALEAIGTQSGRPREEVRFTIEVVSKRNHAYAVKKN